MRDLPVGASDRDLLMFIKNYLSQRANQNELLNENFYFATLTHQHAFAFKSSNY